MPFTQSVILSCAGIGSRLGLGETKALVKILGKSIIAWQLEMFEEVKDLRIVVGFNAMEVVREVQKYRNDVIFVFNHNYFNTKTGKSYLLGSKHANQLAVEWDGDLLVHPDDVKKLLSIKEEYIAYSDVCSDEPVFVRTNSHGEVTNFSREKGEYEWTGPCSIRKERLHAVNGDDVYHLLEPLLPLRGIKVRAQDIDTYEDYKKAESFIKEWK